MHKTSRSHIFYFGIFLTTFSLLGLLYILSPLVGLYINPPKLKTVFAKEEYVITIPKISAQSPIIENVDPSNKNEYRKALYKGVAQAKGSAYPGQGMTYLFAHSSDIPTVSLHVNVPFLRLPELSINDTIYINRNGEEYVYRVTDKKEVWPNEVRVALDSNSPLILQTCTPIGTSFKRLLIFANIENINTK